MKLTKKTAADLVKKLNQKGIKDGTYDTDYGPFWLKIDIEAGDQVATVFGRFEDVERAKEVPTLNKPNPHTGKWNHHVWVEDSDGLVDMVRDNLDLIGAKDVSQRHAKAVKPRRTNGPGTCGGV